MEDIFNPTSFTIKQLFGNTDALYQIPRYQRPYSWGEEQLENLWEDLHDAQASEPYYFLGSIITAKPDERSSYLDIVDGQQRITTLLILFCVVRDHYPKLNVNVIDEDPFAIDSKIIESSIKFNDRFERLRLKTHSNNISDFERLILRPGATRGLKRPTKKDLRREEAPEYKFANTACFFQERLKELGAEAVGEFINYLFNKVKIIRIDCQSVSFAIKLFQVLNDRGLDLSNSDLLKSFLIGEIHRKYASEPELQKQKEEQFVDDWKACQSIANDTSDSLNNLFVVYEYYLLAENPRHSLYDELSTYFANKDPNEIIADFKRFLTYYKTKIFDCESPLIYSLRYLRWSNFWPAVLLTALHTSYPDFERLVSVVRRYFYLNWFAGYTLTRVKQTTFNLIKAIKASRDLGEVEAELEKSLTENQTVARAKERLKGDIYYEGWCKPLLFLMEYNQQDDPKFLELDDKNIHVEHILPRGFESREDWGKVHGNADLKARMNTGANLTLLSGTKNIAASNWGFDRKVQAYSGTGLNSVSDKKVTSFQISQLIVNDYNSGKFKKVWSDEAMSARWSWYCDQLKTLFEIDLQTD
ncbi:MAG: DUF262 domain-containing protein [Pyrinomonadaceae bacterium]|nr:DUF262 domain-containing protein [Pyrinomonadaceae bacterium]